MNVWMTRERSLEVATKMLSVENQRLIDQDRSFSPVPASAMLFSLLLLFFFISHCHCLLLLSC